MTAITPETWKPLGITDFETNALEAVRESRRNVCVAAGAGAGKTEFLAQKAAYLLQTGLCVQPKRILAISFKRDAARNLGARVESRCPQEQARRFDSQTFDAFTKGLLDRFRAAIPAPYSPPRDYRIDFPKAQQIRNFLAAQGFHDQNAQQFERVLARTKHPFDMTTDQAVRVYWMSQYSDFQNVLLSFPMINRLVDWLLRTNPRIRKALQATYPFVFLDEFQDTTYAQYELLNTLFSGGQTVFTAVGDNKQRIMGWAGAMSNAFERFREDYDAKPISLVSNWRSHQDLVVIQQKVAERIDPSSVRPLARARREVTGDVAAIWHYDSNAEQAAGLASWIVGEVANGIAPHDFGILVRQYANDIEDTLAEPLLRGGVRLRNVARTVGDISIQDLLGEELTEILIPLLRLGATSKCPIHWTRTQRSLQFLESVYSDDEAGQARLQDRLQTFVRALRSEMKANRPDGCAARTMALRALDFVGSPVLRRAFSAYQREEDFGRVWDGFLELLVESTGGARNWTEALDQFEGVQQVALMTIHKSKGLEFHTMVFYGLDDRSWKYLEPNQPEELNSFFVALTRARQRAFFTSSAQSGGPVGWIERLLFPVGLNRVPGPKGRV